MDNKLEEWAQNYTGGTLELVDKTLEDGEKTGDDILAENASKTREEADKEAKSDVNGKRESDAATEVDENGVEYRYGSAEPSLDGFQDDLDGLLGDCDASSSQKLRANVTDIFEELLELIVDQLDAFWLTDGARLDLRNGHVCELGCQWLLEQFRAESYSWHLLTNGDTNGVDIVGGLVDGIDQVLGGLVALENSKLGLGNSSAADSDGADLSRGGSSKDGEGQSGNGGKDGLHFKSLLKVLKI